MSPIANYVVSQIEAGNDVHTIATSLQQQGVNDDDITSAFEEAARYERQKAKRLQNEAKELRNLAKAARRPEQRTSGKDCASARGPAMEPLSNGLRSSAFRTRDHPRANVILRHHDGGRQQPLAGLRPVAPGVAVGAHPVERLAQQFRHLAQPSDLRLERRFIPFLARLVGGRDRSGSKVRVLVRPPIKSNIYMELCVPKI
jgi:hypothetical protein